MPRDTLERANQHASQEQWQGMQYEANAMQQMSQAPALFMQAAQNMMQMQERRQMQRAQLYTEKLRQEEYANRIQGYDAELTIRQKRAMTARMEAETAAFRAETERTMKEAKEKREGQTARLRALPDWHGRYFKEGNRMFKWSVNPSSQSDPVRKVEVTDPSELKIAEQSLVKDQNGDNHPSTTSMLNYWRDRMEMMPEAEADKVRRQLEERFPEAWRMTESQAKEDLKNGAQGKKLDKAAAKKHMRKRFLDKKMPPAEQKKRLKEIDRYVDIMFSRGR